MKHLLIEKIKSPSYIMVDGTEVYVNKFGRETTERCLIHVGIPPIFVSPGIYTREIDISIVPDFSEREMECVIERLLASFKIPLRFLDSNFKEPEIVDNFDELKLKFENT